MTEDERRDSVERTLSRTQTDPCRGSGRCMLYERRRVDVEWASFREEGSVSTGFPVSENTSLLMVGAGLV